MVKIGSLSSNVDDDLTEWTTIEMRKGGGCILKAIGLVDHRLQPVPIDEPDQILECSPVSDRNALDHGAFQHHRDGGEDDVGALHEADLRDASAARERGGRLTDIIPADQLQHMIEAAPIRQLERGARPVRRRA